MRVEFDEAEPITTDTLASLLRRTERRQRPRRSAAPASIDGLSATSTRSCSAQFFRRGARYELPRLTLHGLRHTWATLALEQGIHPKVVQERVGHSTIAITLGIYSHVSPTLHDEAAESVARLMLGDG